MKRLLILCIGLFLSIIMLNMSAQAAVNVGGQIFFDTYYYHQDKEGFGRTGYLGSKTQTGTGGIAGIPKGGTTPADDRNQTYFDLNHATHLRFHWSNQQGLGAFIVTYMNADPVQSNASDPGFKVGVSVATLYYDIFKNLRLTVGRGGITQVFSPFDPQTYMGYDGVCKVEALGYGNVNSKYQDGVRLTYKPIPMVGLDLYLANPRLTADTGPNKEITVMIPTSPTTHTHVSFNLNSYAELNGGPGFVAKTGTSVDNNSKIPKVEFAVPITVGGSWGRVAFTPSVMYLKQDFNNVADGDEDSVTSFGLSAGGLVEVKGFKLMAEYTYGENLYTASRIGESTVYPFKYEYIAGGLRNAMGARVYDGKVYDSKTHAFWVQLRYDIMGRVAPTVFYGRNQTKRDMPTDSSPLAGVIDPYGNTDFVTQMYGINMPITIQKNFKIVPEVMFYDNGDKNKINGIERDYGKEWLAGLQFQVFF